MDIFAIGKLCARAQAQFIRNAETGRFKREIRNQLYRHYLIA